MFICCNCYAERVISASIEFFPISKNNKFWESNKVEFAKKKKIEEERAETKLFNDKNCSLNLFHSN